jgi:hypothetical protein
VPCAKARTPISPRTSATIVSLRMIAISFL